MNVVLRKLVFIVIVSAVLAPSLIGARSTYSRELGPPLGEVSHYYRPWFYWSGRRREADVFPKKVFH